MNSGKRFLALCLFSLPSVVFGMETASKKDDPILAALKSDNVSEFQEAIKRESDSSDFACFKVALVYQAGKIAAFYKSRLTQKEINQALLLMVNRESSLEGTRLAVEMGADVNYNPDSGAMNPLESALDEQEYEIADFLFAAGARLPLTKIADPDSSTPRKIGIIHALIKRSHIAQTQKIRNLAWLLDKGYDPDDSGDMKHTAIFDAKRPSEIRLLCQYGADPNSRDEDGYTPLLKLNTNSPKYALKMAIILTHAGANIHYQHPRTRSTILHRAANRGLTDVVAYFLIKGVNRHIQNKFGLLPVELVDDDNDNLRQILLSDTLPGMPAEALKFEAKFLNKIL